MPVEAAASYTRYCAGLRLCPRPLPHSLRGVSFHTVAGLEWYAAKALGIEPSATAWMRDVLAGLARGGNCWFCGALAAYTAELWRVEVRGRTGRAILEALRPACPRCLRVLEARRPSREVVERMAAVNTVSEDTARVVAESISRLLSTAESVGEWEILVEAPGLERATKPLQQAYRVLHETDAVLRGEWLVKGYTLQPCPPPPDPGLLIEALRATGALPSPQAYTLAVIPGPTTRYLWAARIPVHHAAKAIRIILNYRPHYTSIHINTASQGVEVPLEIQLPCYDQLHYHQEALELLQQVAAETHTTLHAAFIVDTAMGPIEAGTTIIRH